jgi:hypothetical protein
MTQCESTIRRGFERPSMAALAPLAIVLVMGLADPASADGVAAASRPAELVRQAHCDTPGQGFTTLKDSDNCLRISGYVTAGGNVAPAEGVPEPPRDLFGPLAAPGIMTGAGGFPQTIVDAPGGGGPVGVFMRVNRGDYAR